MKEAWKKTLETVFILLILAVGGYPAVSDAWNRLAADRMIVQYRHSLWEDSQKSVLEQKKQEAEQYNQELAAAGGGMSAEGRKDYERQLDLDGSGIMGYLEIPKISVCLPVYHGTEDEALARGAGHLEGSSLPVGGGGTHTVLTGHRGLPSAKLFTDLDQLREGDTFRIMTLGDTLEYEVTGIRTVLPEETKDLRILEGKDLATLVTCTPYGVNTHRLLVTGERIPTAGTAAKEETARTAGWEEGDGGSSKHAGSLFVLAGAGAAVLTAACRILWIWCIDFGRRRKKEELLKRRERRKKEELLKRREERERRDRRRKIT